MNQTVSALLALVKSGLTGNVIPLPEQYDLQELCDMSIRHQVAALAYEGAAQCGISRREPAMRQMLQQYGVAVLKSEKQMHELQKLYACFDEAGVDYLPLKGCNMKQLYPKAELRAMNDADILIRPEQYGKIEPLMHKLGYRFEAESDCELKWRTDGLYLELHKRLIPSFIKDFYAYFGDGWQLACVQTGTRYAMSREDEFLFIFTHFARHYREGGIGIRHMADIWYYRVCYPELDESKITSVLKKLGLDTFYQNILATLACWWSDGEETEVTELITDYIISSGTFGNQQTKNVADSARTGKKKERIQKLLFPSVDNMRYAYPVLQKHPGLLPVMWVYRWGKIAFAERGKLEYQRDRLKNETDEKLDAFERSMRAVGINLQYEENE